MYALVWEFLLSIFSFISISKFHILAFIQRFISLKESIIIYIIDTITLLLYYDNNSESHDMSYDTVICVFFSFLFFYLTFSSLEKLESIHERILKTLLKTNKTCFDILSLLHSVYRYRLGILSDQEFDYCHLTFILNRL